jgi:hypothetical protein
MRCQFAKQDVLHAIDLLGRLPTQTVRSEEQIEWQQHSTPLNLAAVAPVLAAAMTMTSSSSPAPATGSLSRSSAVSPPCS